MLSSSTLFPKRNATLISRFFIVTLDQGQWPRGMSIQGNAPGSNQEQCKNVIWPKVHWPTLFPKRKATSGEECKYEFSCRVNRLLQTILRWSYYGLIIRRRWYVSRSEQQVQITLRPPMCVPWPIPHTYTPYCLIKLIGTHHGLLAEKITTVFNFRLKLLSSILSCFLWALYVQSTVTWMPWYIY